MSKNKIIINDFKLFESGLQALSKLVNCAKFMIDQTGLTIYSRNEVARGEMHTTALMSESPIEFSLLDISMLNKIIRTISEVHQDDFSELEMTYSKPLLRFESTKFKTKLSTCDENKITNFISKKITTQLTPVLEFTTNSNNIKYINNHSFLFKDLSSTRIYLNIDDKMQNNTLYATLGNESNDLNNSITLKFGLINYGKLDNRKLILDFERLNAFNIINSDSIKIELMDKNVLVNKIHIDGSSGTYLDFTIYNSMLVS